MTDTTPALPTKPLVWRPHGEYLRATTDLGDAYLIQIVRVPSPAQPGTKDETEYALRHVDPASLRAYGPRCTGYHHSQHYTAKAAMDSAERHAWARRQGAECHVPATYPAIMMERFFWPISDGTSQAALAIATDDGRLVARVVGMGRKDDDRYHPETYVEITLADAGHDFPPTAELETPR